MLKLFTPDYYIHSFATLRPEYLKERGIRLLICDIDNTLVPHDVAVPDEKAVKFIHGMQEAGIRVVFISNNVEERVATFAKDFQADCYPFAMKPLPKTYWRMLKEQGVEKKEVAAIGDQLMTDILGANLVGLHTVLTAPIVTRDLSFTKFNRVFENMVFKLLRKTGRLRKGEFDE